MAFTPWLQPCTHIWIQTCSHLQTTRTAKSLAWFQRSLKRKKPSMMPLIRSPDVQDIERSMPPPGLGINQTGTIRSSSCCSKHPPVSKPQVHAVSPPLLLTRPCYPVNLVYDLLSNLFPSILHWGIPYDVFCKLSDCYFSKGNHRIMSVNYLWTYDIHASKKTIIILFLWGGFRESMMMSWKLNP